MIDVVALGELLIDFAAKSTDSAGYPTMAANPGGAPGNFLAALNAYGRKTAFLGKVGNDAFGNLLLGTLNAAGIETKGILVDDSVFTTLAFVTFDESGDRSFSFARKPGADTQLRWEEVDKSLIDEAKVFHFGTLSLTDEPVRVFIVDLTVDHVLLVILFAITLSGTLALVGAGCGSPQEPFRETSYDFH